MRGNGRESVKSTSRISTKRVAGGIFWLSVAGILVKVIGLVFKIPLTNMIGDSGMGYFNSAYTVYTFFYTLSSAGLPVALSICVSSAIARSERKTAGRIFKVALLMFFVTGLVLALGMYFGAGVLSSAVSNNDARFAVRAMAPSLLLVCVSGAYRGYFQGMGSMTQTSLSQVIESAGKLVFGLVLASYAVKEGKGPEICACYAVMGITLSECVSTLYLMLARLFQGGSKPRTDNDRSQKVSNLSIAQKIARIALPISMGSAVMSLSGVLDLAVVMRSLQSIGYCAETANALFGAYTSLAVPMFNMPVVLIAPIVSCLVPFIANAISAGDREGAVEGAKNCLKYATFIALPASLGLSALSRGILELFFAKELALSVAPYLEILALAVIFVAYTNVCIAIMQSSGHTLLPIIVMCVGSAVKVITAVLCIRRFGMAGTPVSSLACYFVMSILCFAIIERKLNIRINFFKMICPCLVSSLLCAFCARVSYNLLFVTLGKGACLVSLVIAVAVYLLSVILFKYIKKEDLAGLPVIGRLVK